MEYRIIRGSGISVEGFAGEVRRAIGEGWEPLGGVGVGGSDLSITLLQALIRRPKPWDGTLPEEAYEDPMDRDI